MSTIWLKGWSQNCPKHCIQDEHGSLSSGLRGSRTFGNGNGFLLQIFPKNAGFSSRSMSCSIWPKRWNQNCPKHCDIVYKSAAKVRACAEPKPLRISSIKNSTKFAPWELICQQRFFTHGPLSGQKDGVKTAQNIVYKMSSANKFWACGAVKNLALEIVLTHN